MSEIRSNKHNNDAQTHHSPKTPNSQATPNIETKDYFDLRAFYSSSSIFLVIEFKIFS